MDGLLLDTERLHLECFRFSAEAHGYAADIEAYKRCIGSMGEDSRRILRDAYGSGFPLESVLDAWSARYHCLIDRGHLQVKPGARAVLETARRHGVPCALATSTRRPLAERKLGIAGLREFFVFMVTGDDVANGKPDPEPYRKAARGLGLETRSCWALEDSENGVRAAVGAGCIVFQVPDLVQPSAEVRALGHHVVESLMEVEARLRKVIGASD